MVTTSAPNRRGLTLVELIVVIVVVGILAMLLMSGSWGTYELSSKAKCGKNQSGIFSALTAYQENGQAGWPNARGKIGLPANGAGAIPAGEDCARYTVGIFEILADQFRDALPAVVFRCPDARGATRGLNPDLRPSATRPDTTWGWGAAKIPYAMDWSAPADAGSARPLLADRDATNHRKGQVVVCWADGHYGTLDSSERPATPNVTISIGYGDGKPPTRTVIQTTKGATDDDVEPPDNIYDDLGDQIPGRPDANRMPGQGHPRRAIMW